ncbi:division/cell wall cluster transcriptional repressor MraZ [Sphingomonas sp. LT1P40]|uniref:division/cell wall cluster transcriptional repressor MraZ n=1 Tax=Alteristakelama amylovorans TaxID=3096166 RepID=UPI002FC97114
MVDDKGRVAIPSTLRATLEKNSGHPVETKEARVAIVSTHESDPCLVAYDEPWFDELHAELKQRAMAFAGDRGRADANIMREGIGTPENIGFDPSGRFVMPGLHLKRGKIAKSGYAFFYGVGDVIEIWDPKTLLDHPTAPEGMKDACRFYLDEKKVVL